MPEHVIDALIPAPGGGSILVDLRSPTPSLPRAAATQVQETPSEIARISGARCGYLRPLHRADDDDSSRHIWLYELWEGVAPSQGYDWMTCESFAQACNDPHAVEALRIWLEQESLGLPERSQSWQRMGWIDEVVVWLRGALGTSELTLDLWDACAETCILRVEAGNRTYFFKGAADWLAFEPAVTAHIAGVAPLCSPEIVAIDAARGWMLMQELEGVTLSSCNDPRPWVATAEALARLQCAIVGSEPILAAHHLPERRPETLAERVRTLLRRLAPASDAGEERSLDDQSTEVDAILASLPLVEQAADDLAACGVPLTLDHGDLHGGNVMVLDGAPRIFDWAEGSLSHPFFSLYFLERHAGHLLAENAGAVTAAMRETYLAHWRERFPQADLDLAIDLAWLLAPFHRGVIWGELHEHAPDHFRDEPSDRAPRWLRHGAEVITTRYNAAQGAALERSHRRG